MFCPNKRGSLGLVVPHFRLRLLNRCVDPQEFLRGLHSFQTSLLPFAGKKRILVGLEGIGPPSSFERSLRAAISPGCDSRRRLTSGDRLGVAGGEEGGSDAHVSVSRRLSIRVREAHKPSPWRFRRDVGLISTVVTGNRRRGHRRPVLPPEWVDLVTGLSWCWAA